MTEQQKDFVHMYLKHRDKIVAHNLAYGNNPNYDSVESSANRLLRIPEIADTIRSIQDTIRHEVEEEFKARYREELLSIYDKRMLLKRIATGEMYVEQKYKGKNCTQCSQYISPTINQMLAAIREDNKLAGHHPHKVAGKWVIPALQTGQEQVLSENAVYNTSPSGVGGEQLAQENTPEKENKGQHPGKIDIENQPFTGDNTDSFSLPFRGIGGEFPQENTPEKDNKIEQPGEASSMSQIEKDFDFELTQEKIDIDNQPLIEEITPLLFLGGDIGAGIYADKRQSGWLPREEQEKLRELLYPQKPKLSYMKNNP